MAPQICSLVSSGKGLPELGLDRLLVALDDLLPVVGLQVRIDAEPVQVLVVVEDVLEHAVVDAEHDVGVHLDEAAVAVVGEALVARALGEALHRLVVEAEIEDRVHHAGHGGARPRAHRDEQRIALVAEFRARRLADLGQRRLDLRLELRRNLPPARIVGVADLGRDREARRHGQPEARHLGEIGALAPEQRLHVGAAFRHARAEKIDPFRNRCLGGFRPCHARALRRSGIRALAGTRRFA